ncbi:MAG: tetratricopeptide repeat protein [Brevirhabdus sp.]
MRHSTLVALCLGSTVALSACQKSSDAEVQRALDSVNVVDESNLNDIMLTVADPNEAVAYFRKATKQDPDRIDLKRGLARSLIRAKKAREAVPVFAQIVRSDEAVHDDRVDYADSLIRIGEWDKAKAQLDQIPPTHETFKRYRLEAMVADSKQDWKRADSFYETAVGLTTRPASVLNNWGYSKLTRGDFQDAEKLFVEAIGYDKTLFTAKNNLVLARGAQRNYQLPIVPMTQVERAQLLYTMALSAIKQNDLSTGKALLREAIDTHPQHFEAAVRSLNTLEANSKNG